MKRVIDVEELISKIYDPRVVHMDENGRVKREEVINAITQFVENYACGSDLIGLNTAIETLKKERPHGEWVNEGYGIGKCWATCSECGESTNGEAQDNGFGYDYSFPNFCPNCGADMREEGEAE